MSFGSLSSEHSTAIPGQDARRRLLRTVPGVERRLDLAGVSTAVIEAGTGPPVVLLHGPSSYGVAWQPVIEALASSHRVIAPDLPGHGASVVRGDPPDADGVMAWLGELIEWTCPVSPVVVGHLTGGAIAARFAARFASAPFAAARRLARLVLVVPFGLAEFQPDPGFGAALTGFLSDPGGQTHDELWRRHVNDFDALRDRLAERWHAMRGYNVDLARTPAVAAALRTVMVDFGFPAIPPAELGRIAVPTTLIWGRSDSVVRLAVAEAASARYGWPLRVIDNAGNEPALENPRAFLRALDLAPDLAHVRR